MQYAKKLIDLDEKRRKLLTKQMKVCGSTKNLCERPLAMNSVANRNYNFAMTQVNYASPDNNYSTDYIKTIELLNHRIDYLRSFVSPEISITSCDLTPRLLPKKQPLIKAKVKMVAKIPASSPKTKQTRRETPPARASFELFDPLDLSFEARGHQIDITERTRP